MRKIVRSFRKTAPRKLSAAPRKLRAAPRELHAAPRKLEVGKLAGLTNNQPEALMQAQNEFYGLIEQANRNWLARIEKERAMASELVTKLSGAKGLPDIANAYRECLMRRVDMIAEDIRDLIANTQRFMNAHAMPRAQIWAEQKLATRATYELQKRKEGQMQTPRARSELLSPEQLPPFDLVRQIKKLRWIGMEEEARELQKAISRRLPAGQSEAVLADAPCTDWRWVCRGVLSLNQVCKT
jgi:hypothetical protein